MANISIQSLNVSDFVPVNEFSFFSPREEDIVFLLPRQKNVVIICADIDDALRFMNDDERVNVKMLDFPLPKKIFQNQLL